MCSSLEFLYVMHICLGCIAPLPSVCAFMNARFVFDIQNKPHL